MSLSRKSIRARRSFLLKVVFLGIAVAAFLALFKWFTYDRDRVTTDNAFVTGNIIPVMADATGVVAAVNAEETQFVKKGDVLVRLDAQRARAVLGQAEAELGRAVRAVGALFANRQQVCQKLASRKAIRERTWHDLARYRSAAPSGAASRQILQNTEDQLAAQEADLRETRAELQAFDARLINATRVSHPDIEWAKARFNDAYVETLRQSIRAPATGYVAKRRVQVGFRVKPGDQIMNIVRWIISGSRPISGRTVLRALGRGRRRRSLSISTGASEPIMASSKASCPARAACSPRCRRTTPPATSSASCSASRCASRSTQKS